MSWGNFWFGGVFAALGLLFAAIGGVFVWSDHRLAAIGEEARGTVTGFETSHSSDSGTSYKPRVSFTADDGQRYSFTSAVGSSPPAFSRGEEVTVIYDPWSPQDAMIDSFTQRRLFPLAFSGFGILFAVIGLVMVGGAIHRRRVIAGLRRTGIAIEADFRDCRVDSSMEVNGRNPWRLVCEGVHPASGQPMTFESDPVWDDWTYDLYGRKLRVLVDPHRPDRYFVDVEASLAAAAA